MRCTIAAGGLLVRSVAAGPLSELASIGALHAAEVHEENVGSMITKEQTGRINNER